MQLPDATIFLNIAGATVFLGFAIFYMFSPTNASVSKAGIFSALFSAIAISTAIVLGRCVCCKRTDDDD